MKNKKISLDDAVNLLPDKNSIHTFRQSSIALAGAYYTQLKIIELINKFSNTLELSDQYLDDINYGISICDNDGYLYIETDNEKINVFENE